MTSCGYAVPTIKLETPESYTVHANSDHAAGPAETLPASTDKTLLLTLQDRPLLEQKTIHLIKKNRLNDLYTSFNTRSLDGLPGFRFARKMSGERFLWVKDVQSWMKKKFAYPEAILLGFLLGICFVMLVLQQFKLYMPQY